MLNILLFELCYSYNNKQIHGGFPGKFYEMFPFFNGKIYKKGL